MDLIENFIFQKKNWIDDKLKTARRHLEENPPKEFKNGEYLTFLGKEYPLLLDEKQRTPITFNNGFILSKDHLHRARENFVKWYKMNAYSLIDDRLKKYSVFSGLKYTSFRLSNAKKRWGSCGPSNSLSFNWRLIMAPIFVIDYVIAHELAHLEEKNHSKRFWKKVADIFPAFKTSKNWLKMNGHKLAI